MDNKLKKIVENAFFVLKYEQFYDNFNHHLKMKIACFENSNFFKKCNQLIIALNNFLIDGENDYFIKFINKIDVNPVLKNKGPDEKWKLNYFIDAPIEILIIDYIWSMLFLKYYQKLGNTEFLYANLFNFKILNLNPFEDDFNRKLLFKRYKFGYNSWLSELEKKFDQYKNLSDITLLSLDYSRFYYCLNNPLETLINQNKNLFDDFFIKISNLLLAIQNNYNLKLLKLTSLTNSNNIMLPIGLASSRILSNYSLLKVDKEFISADNLIFYGRYVDDMLFLFKGKIETNQLLNQLKFILKNNKISNNLTFNKDKIKSFVFNQNSSKMNFKNKLNKINTSYYFDDFDFSTAFNLFSSIDRNILNSNLIDNRLSEDLFLSFDLNKILIIWNVFLLNIELDQKTIKIIYEKILTETNFKIKPYLLFLSLKFISKYFPKMIENYYKKLNLGIGNEINELMFVHNEIKKNSINILCSSIQSFYYNQIKGIFSISLSEKFEENNSLKNLAKLHSNLKKAGFVRVEPIFNNLINQSKKQPIINEITMKKYFGNTLQFVHYFDLSLYQQFLSLIFKNKSKNIINTFYKRINNIKEANYYLTKKRQIILEKFKYLSFSFEIKDESRSENKFVISQPKINIDDDDSNLKSLSVAPNLKETLSFINILSISRENRTNLLILPELYVRLEWINFLLEFSRNSNIDVVFGVSPVIFEGHYFNFMIHACSTLSKTKNKIVLPFVREKNDYSYKEINFCKKNSLIVENAVIPNYFNFIKPNYKSSSYLCFEVTDIYARALFKGKTDLIIVPMLNKDTNYFDNIVESLSRDMSVIVATSNSALVGNSAIILPRETAQKKLTEFKGGFNEYVVSSNIPLIELRDFNKTPYDEKKKDNFKPHSAHWEVND